ncbi:MAG: hypothetical protein PHU88_06030 [candidate division Zixibacteria bacterium]|nr:hypothetical protein [candidate division Zixibacteria bacterium]MDD5426914.1 hypothetical protein [candidate division Zixibacteria bacterium]
MIFKDNIIGRVSLLTLAVMVIPLLFFPRMFGTELARTSFVNLLYELVFYGFLMFLFNRRITLLQLLLSAGLCLVYRLFLGATFGLIIAGLYSMNLLVSLQLGLFSYLPVLLFNILVTPFILKPLTDKISRRKDRGVRKSNRPGIMMTAEAPTPAMEISKEPEKPLAWESPVIPVTAPIPAVTAKAEPLYGTSSAMPQYSYSPGENTRSFLQPDINGFERAVRYIGEHASVHLTTVVDHEGLLLANFKRGDLDPEVWAPMALIFLESNRQVLNRTVKSTPVKVDIVLEAYRIVIARINKVNLMVVAEHHSDDVLKIRISQGIDIIKKYIEERYAKILEDKVENINVPSIK